MKLRTLGMVLSLSCLGLYGCEESTEGTDAEMGAEGEAAMEEGAEGAEGEAAEGEAAEGEGEGEGEEEPAGPAEVCGQLVEAVAAWDEAALTELSTADMAEVLGDANAQKGMQSAMEGASCGEAAIEGESAQVPATAGEDTRDIPFAQADGAWKFDVAAYQEAFPAADEAPAKRKAKRKGRKGRKGRRKRR